jgi:hypothetical protein
MDDALNELLSILDALRVDWDPDDAHMHAVWAALDRLAEAMKAR